MVSFDTNHIFISVYELYFYVGDNMKCVKNGMILGLVGATLIGTGFLIYNYVLSPRTKRELRSFEEDMCDDFENMI